VSRARPTPTERFYEPGRRLLRWLEQAGLGRDHPLAHFSAPLLLGAAWIWAVVAPGPVAFSAVVACFAYQGLLSYLSGADALTQRDARQEVWERVEKLNADTMGHLAVLMRVYRERAAEPERMSPLAFRLVVTGIQQNLLAHLVDAAAEHHGLRDRRALSANWAMEEPETGAGWFRPLLYDRNMSDRQPSTRRRYPIAADAAGAPEAFRTGQVALVPDTQAPEARPWFRADAPYRCVLSFPVKAGDEVLGVVNLDAVEPAMLDHETAHLIRHVAYLVGLCETLKQNATEAPALPDHACSSSEHNGASTPSTPDEAAVPAAA
jgi:GAF domain-containing protein